jgi:CBS domain containing-hemolysin-like protein
MTNNLKDIGTLLFAFGSLGLAAMVTASHVLLSSLPESSRRGFIDSNPSRKRRSFRHFLERHHGTFSQGTVTSVAYASFATLLVHSYLPIATVIPRALLSVGVTAFGFGILTEAFKVLGRWNSNRFLPIVFVLSGVVECSLLPVTFLVTRLCQGLSLLSRRKETASRHFEPVVSSAMRITERSRSNHEEQDPPIVDLGAGRLVVDANLPIADLGRYLGIELPNPKSYPSIERLVIEESGAVPPVGTVLRLYGFDFVVSDRSLNRVVKVEIHRQFSLRDTFNPHSSRPSPESKP